MHVPGPVASTAAGRIGDVPDVPAEGIVVLRLALCTATPVDASAPAARVVVAPAVEDGVGDGGVVNRIRDGEAAVHRIARRLHVAADERRLPDLDAGIVRRDPRSDGPLA